MRGDEEMKRMGVICIDNIVWHHNKTQSHSMFFILDGDSNRFAAYY